MSATEWAQGDLATYDGIMTGRCGQRATICGVMRDGDLGLRFSDGAIIRVPRKSVRRVTAPQGSDF